MYKMKILMFGWEFPPHISGGLGTACYGITKSISQHGHDIIFVMPKASGEEDKRYAEIISADKINVLGNSEAYDEVYKKMNIITINSSILPYVSTTEYLRQKLKIESQIQDSWSKRYVFNGAYGSSLMDDVANYTKVAHQIACDYEGKYDVIHAHDWLTYNAGVIAKQISGKPLIVHVHATDFDRGGNGKSDIYKIEKFGMDNADKIVAVSKLTKKIIIEKYNQPADKIEVVHNGLTPSPKKTRPEKKHFNGKIVTFLGRITQQKGPTYFVEVAKLVAKHNPDTHFVMAGNGDMLPLIIKLVASAGLSHRFHFTGFLTGNEVDAMLAMSDVYIMPSVSEPFGISPLEAINSSIPVIISKQSGVAEVLKNALKVDYWDIEATADKVNAILRYPILKNFLVKHSQREVNKMTWEEPTQKLIDIYNFLIKSNI
ncbi:MAG: glycosyltransferase family 4 protein [Bacteroidetes bacterium]|nr:glycosyltransferase family 4 protein [Bacteroidota bacterium]